MTLILLIQMYVLFCNRICNVNSPSRNIMYVLFIEICTYGKLTQGTLLHRVVRSSQSPIDPAFSSTVNLRNNDILHDGHIDSIIMLPYHENFMKPYSDEHLLNNANAINYLVMFICIIL